MSEVNYDVIVIGLGAMGSAATYQLARSGARVLGIDRYKPPHAYGSTHGDTRITRLAIGEGAEYVPLVMRSHELWREIEREVGYELLNQCGGLIMSTHSDQQKHGTADFLYQTIEIAEQYRINHEKLTAAQMKSRFPELNLAGAEDGYYEPEAGFLRPEKCLQANLELTEKYGGNVHFGERAVSFEANNDFVQVWTDRATYTAEKLVISVGPWINDLIDNYTDIFKIYRQVLYWFDLKDQASYATYSKLPVFIWEFGGGHDNFIYGFPAIDGATGGLKVASEDYTVENAPDQAKREVTADEIDNMYERYIKDRLPGLSRNCIRAASCLYTVTPDHRFVIDRHPHHDNIIIASPCSGHGFKHSAAIGEVLAQLTMTGKSDIDISAFALSRFSRLVVD